MTAEIGIDNTFRRTLKRASMRPRSNDRGNSLYRNQLIFNNLPRQMRAATSQTPESESFTDPSYV